MSRATDIIASLVATSVQDGTAQQSEALNEAAAYLKAFEGGFAFDQAVFARASERKFKNGKPLWVYLADNPAMGNVAIALLEAYLEEMEGPLARRDYSDLELLDALRVAFAELSKLEPHGYSFSCMDRIAGILSKAEGR